MPPLMGDPGGASAGRPGRGPRTQDPDINDMNKERGAQGSGPGSAPPRRCLKFSAHALESRERFLGGPVAKRKFSICTLISLTTFCSYHEQTGTVRIRTCKNRYNTNKFRHNANKFVHNTNKFVIPYDGSGFFPVRN